MGAFLSQKALFSLWCSWKQLLGQVGVARGAPGSAGKEVLVAAG